MIRNVLLMRVLLAATPVCADEKGLRFRGPGRHRPNRWHDGHSDVAQWTRITYRPCPYDAADGHDTLNQSGRKVVRGGSWRDRPHRCTSSFRHAHQPYHRAFNVGFRVVCRADTRPASGN